MEFRFGNLTTLNLPGRFLAPPGGWSTNPDTATALLTLSDGLIQAWGVAHLSPIAEADITYTLEVSSVVQDTIVLASGAALGLSLNLAILVAPTDIIGIGVDGSSLSANRALRTTATVRAVGVR